MEFGHFDAVNANSHTANVYKCLLRERIANINDEKSNFELFHDILEKDRKLRLFYVDTCDLFDDFVCLYNQFHALKSNGKFVRYYESLLHRIAEYEAKIQQRAKNHPNQFQETLDELHFLETTAEQEMKDIKKHENEKKTHNIYTSLGAILDDANKTIANLDDYHNRTRKQYALNEYKKHFTDKIRLAEESIQKQILPKLERLIRKAEQKVQTVADDFNQKQDKVEGDIHEREEEKKKLQESLRWHLAANTAKVIGHALSFFGPSSLIVGSAILFGPNTSKAQRVQSVEESNHLQKLEKSLKKISADVKDDLEPFKCLTKEFEQIKSKVKHETPELKEIFETVQSIKLKLRDEKSKKGICDPTQLYKLRKKLVKQLETYEMKLKKENHGKDSEHLDVAKRLGKALWRPLYTLYTQYKKDKKKIEAVGDAISKLHEEIEVWKNYEIRIYDVMLPEFKRFESQLNESIKLNGDQALPELCIRKWEFEEIYAEFMRKTNEMCKESTAQEDLVDYMNAVKSGMNKIVEVYGYIDQYKEKGGIAELIATLVSNECHARSALELKLEEIILNRMLMEQYKISMRSFVRHYFPFVPKFKSTLGAKHFKSKGFGHNKISVKCATQLIKDMHHHHKVKTMPKNLTYATFGGNPSFYVWTYENNKTEICQLLKGETVQLKADILSGLSEYAVKFKEIEILLKAVDAEQQMNLDAALENCDITLICGRDHRYRYGEQIYLIPMENELEIQYKIVNGQTTNWNDLLKFQIPKNDDYFLSPYNTWTIQLKGETLAEKLSGIEINLQLVGNGQFIKNNETVELSDYDLSDQMVQFAFNESIIVETVSNEKRT